MSSSMYEVGKAGWITTAYARVAAKYIKQYTSVHRHVQYVCLYMQL